MAFVPTDLRAEMEKFADATSPNFIESPQTQGDAAEYWANALDVYGAAITPPSTTIAAAHSAFIGLFNSMTPLTGLAQFPACFTAYATALAGGMAAAGFTGVPPSIPIDFSSVGAAAQAGADQTECLTLLVTILDTWFKTGLATPNAGGPPIPWS